jgi:hypothetical protein
VCQLIACLEDDFEQTRLVATQVIRQLLLMAPRRFSGQGFFFQFFSSIFFYFFFKNFFLSFSLSFFGFLFSSLSFLLSLLSIARKIGWGEI